MKTQEWLAELREALLADSEWRVALNLLPSKRQPLWFLRKGDSDRIYCPTTVLAYHKSGVYAPITAAAYRSIRGELTYAQAARIQDATDGWTGGPIRKAIQEIWDTVQEVHEHEEDDNYNYKSVARRATGETVG